VADDLGSCAQHRAPPGRAASLRVHSACLLLILQAHPRAVAGQSRPGIAPAGALPKTSGRRNLKPQAMIRANRRPLSARAPGGEGRMRERCDTVVIGGGQAGLAMSYHLRERGLEHLVLERRRVAERWRSERWSSLHFQFPNWSLNLPGFKYRGGDPNGFAHHPEIAPAMLGGSPGRHCPGARERICAPGPIAVRRRPGGRKRRLGLPNRGGPSSGRPNSIPLGKPSPACATALSGAGHARLDAPDGANGR
jgi:hypothetical protein